MKTRNFMLAAAALSVLACNDATAPAFRPHSGSGDNPTLGLELSGRVAVERNGQSVGVILTTREGMRVTLIGNQADVLASVPGGDVLVRGAWEVATEPPDTIGSGGPDRAVAVDPDLPGVAAGTAAARFIVWEFEVLGMLDRQALDGFLELTIDGYALRLANGDVRLVTGCPESIAEYVGARLWVVGSEEEPPVVFGLIAAR